MSTLTSPGGPRALPASTARSRSGSRLRALVPTPELGALLILAATLGLWGLSRNGMANLYYSAAVRSMTESWSNFFFGSFDASGVMTVDKPPLSLWVQAASVKVFGFNSWAILVPEALMSVASVGLTYDLVRRPFGRVAATVAGLALAITPISVAMARHNNPEALLTLCSVAAVWFAVRGLRDHRMRWMVLSGVSIGLGFEAKMAAALMVVPGIAAAYMWVAPRGLRGTASALAAWAGSMVVVGLAWPVAVWLTPAGSRPWVSGTSDNSIWSLILGYNGLGRLFGQSGGPAGGGGGGTFGGNPGLTRMWNQAIGGQIGWLLGGSLVAVAGVAVLSRMRRRDVRTGWLLAVGGSLVVTFVAFSKASGIFHPYYVALLAPFVAALFGAGVGVALGARAGEHERLVGVLTIGGGVAGEMAVMGSSATDLTGWRVPVVIIASVGAVLVGMGPRRLALIGATAAVAALSIAPGIWAVKTLGHATSETFPAGGPASAGMGFGGGGPGGMGGTRPSFGGGTMTPPAGMTPPSGMTGTPPSGGTGTAPSVGGGGGMGGNESTSTVTAALTYATQHGGGTVAVSSQNGAASQLIIAGNTKVVAIGGFSGRESQVTVSWLADAVASGKIRYVLTTSSNGGMPNDTRVGSTDVMTAAAKVGTATSVSGLVDLSGKAAALRALAG